MANKRQRKARQSFSQQQQQQSAAEPKDNRAVKPEQELKTKKKAGQFKSGKKPGEVCFLCRSRDHIARLCPKKAQLESKKICLLCREQGHSLKHCPDNDKQGRQVKLCYNCGETGHRLSLCPQPLKEGGTSFAECFVCKGRGHISKDCPSNKHGIYPKGGACKVCGEVTHLAKDCANKTANKRNTKGPAKLKLKISKEAAPAGDKRLVFKSGDDLEDDFGELD